MARLRLFVIRHGETTSTLERRFAGSREVPLTATGVRQCEAVARALAGEPVAAVYASPQERARTSAETIAKPHHLEVRVLPAFREMGFGPWEGLSREDVGARFAEDYARWRTAPHTLALPGAETLPGVAARVRDGLATLAAAHEAQTVVLVAHAIVARILVLDALGLGLDRLWAVDASPAGITEVELEPGWATVHRMNTLVHLEGPA